MKNFLKSTMAGAVLLCSNAVFSQNFTWMKGGTTLDLNGTYGQLTVTATNNNPGAREAAMEWKDSNGDFWILGGYGYSNSSTVGDLLNDLWRYEPATNNWTWIKGDSVQTVGGVYGTQGTPANANKPGARVDGASWADASGNLWLFGGVGLDGNNNTGWLNDLWKYNTFTNQWTWVKGNNGVDVNGAYGTITVASNTTNPGARHGAVTWVDGSGNFWLFGGYGFDASGQSADYLNDLWRYNPGTNQWTWMKGSNTAAQPGVYGTINVASNSNIPGSRWGSSAVINSLGTVYLFGGDGVDGTNNFGLLNDVWSYNSTTNQFTWIGGSNTGNQPGAYGTLATPSTTNIPGARMGHLSWVDGTNNIWLFGGVGFDASSSFSDQINDLWRYNPSLNQWTWMKGSNTVAQSGTYGTQLVPAATNIPGARFFSSGWTGNNSEFFLFGGSGYDSQNYGSFNDLWRFSNCTAAPITITSSGSVTCPGTIVSLTAAGASSYTWMNVGSGSTATLAPTVNTTITLISTNSTGCPNGAVYSHSVRPAPLVSVTAMPSPLCMGQTATLTASGANSYLWTGLGTSPTVTVSPVADTEYTVTGTGAFNCQATVTYSLPVFNSPTVTIIPTKTLICKGETVVLIAAGAASYVWQPSGTTGNTIAVAPLIQTSYSVTGTDQNGCSATGTEIVKVSVCFGLDQHEQTLNVLLYPNPASGPINVKLADGFGAQRLSLINVAGQEVYQSVIVPGENTIHLDLPAGIYYYTISTGENNAERGKLVIE